MKEYLKMSDVFKGGVNVRIKAPRLIECGGVLTANCLCEQSAEYAAHAINSHDELVENMKHYKQEAGQWEARATKEASRAQDLEAEVERLCEIIMLAIEVNESMAGAVPATDWGEGFRECATSTSKALMETASKHSTQWVAYQMAKRGK